MDLNNVKNSLKKFFSSANTPAKLEKSLAQRVKPIIDHSKLQIAIITPKGMGEYLTNTVIDGLIERVKEKNDVTFYLTNEYPSPFSSQTNSLDDEEFIPYAQAADLILFFIFDQERTRYDLVEKIGGYEKTLLFDGTELKHNNRLDYNIQKQLIYRQYKNLGGINDDMLKKCALYFRREKPYLENIVAFPYGIESRYLEKYNPEIKKDIDFVCIFGQEDYPLMRKYCREILEDFCKKNDFICATKKTEGFNFETKKVAGRDDFYSLLARAKVGISISGGGFDTARFWETLANNCLLLTEAIDIYPLDSQRLKYKRIFEFRNVFDFYYQLEKIGDFLKNNYRQNDLEEEYNKIIKEHGTLARVEEILAIARNKGIIK